MDSLPQMYFICSKTFQDSFYFRDFFLFQVPPQLLRIISDPTTLAEELTTVVQCKVSQVKPFGNLEIQLLNGTSQLEARLVQEQLNPDGLTVSVTKEYDVIFSRQVHLFCHHSINPLITTSKSSWVPYVLRLLHNRPCTFRNTKIVDFRPKPEKQGLGLKVLFIENPCFGCENINPFVENNNWKIWRKH